VIIAPVALSALLILALFVPLEMTVQVSTAERPRLRMRLVWLFGLVRKEIGRGEKKQAAPKKRGKRRINPRDILSLLQTRGLLPRLKTSFQGMLRALEIKNLAADFKVGLGDPADTGLLFALLAPVIPWLNSSLPLQIRAQPSFADAPTFAGHSHGAVRVRPIRLILPLLSFALSPATMRAAKKLALARWRRK
jgi:hypothetical protein